LRRSTGAGMDIVAVLAGIAAIELVRHRGHRDALHAG
jgi:hypothetical protein